MDYGDDWFWFIKSETDFIPVFPNRPLTVGKRTDNLINIGKRSTATSKNFITIYLAKNQTTLHCVLNKGATLKVFANGARVTAAKPQIIKSTQHVYIEKEDFDAEFIFREKLCITTASVNKAMWPKTWKFTILPDTSSTIVTEESGDEIFTKEPHWFDQMEDVIRGTVDERNFETMVNCASQKTNTSFKKPKVVAKAKRQKDLSAHPEDDDQDDLTIQNLSTNGREDYNAMQAHLAMRAQLPDNYRTKAQILFQTLQVTPQPQQVPLPSHTSSKCSNPLPSIFKNSRIKIHRANLVYD